MRRHAGPRHAGPASLAAVCVLLLGGCGGDDQSVEGAASTATVTASASPSATATATAAATASPSSTPTEAATPTPAAGGGAASPAPRSTDPEAAPGGAGDEEEIRIRLTLVIDGEGITPPTRTVPALLPLELTLRNDLPQPVKVTIEGVRNSIQVPASGSVVRSIAGLRTGFHVVDAGSAGRARLIADPAATG